MAYDYLRMNGVLLKINVIKLFEVEIKAKIKNFNEIKENLIKLGAIKKKLIIMDDYYFKHPNKDFGKTDEALRIRITDEKKYLTYKGPKLDEITKTREEIEIEIQEPEKFKVILKKLGFIEVPKISKKREIYEINKIKICLDDVQFIGKFIELEIEVNDEEDRIKKVNELIKFAENIGIKQKDFIRKSYLELVKEGVKGYI